MTEADIRLVTKVLRLNIVDVGRFKCNIRRITDYHALSLYLVGLFVPQRRASRRRDGVALILNEEERLYQIIGGHDILAPAPRPSRPPAAAGAMDQPSVLNEAGRRPLLIEVLPHGRTTPVLLGRQSLDICIG